MIISYEFFSYSTVKFACKNDFQPLNNLGRGKVAPFSEKLCTHVLYFVVTLLTDSRFIWLDFFPLSFFSLSMISRNFRIVRLCLQFYMGWRLLVGQLSHKSQTSELIIINWFYFVWYSSFSYITWFGICLTVVLCVLVPR